MKANTLYKAGLVAVATATVWAGEAETRVVGNPAFVHLEQEAGIWWFADGTGQRFVSIGVNHLEAPVFLAPYNRERTLATYGSGLVDSDGRLNPNAPETRQWATRQADTVRSWGFNTLGAHVSPRGMFKDCGLFHVAVFHGAYISHGKKPGAPWPDPFDPKFAAAVDTLAASYCGAHREDPRLLGYMFADMPAFTQDPLTHQWLAYLKTRPATAAGKQAWIDVLRSRHASAADAAATHGVAARTWDELAGCTAWPTPTHASVARADGDCFLERVVDRWLAVHAGAARKHDPNHLVLGDKVAFDGLSGWDAVPAWLPAVLARHVDVLNIQYAGRIQHQQTFLIRLYQAAGKPILNGDAGFNIVNPHQTRAKGVKVATHDLMGREYEAYLHGLMSLPFMVGLHHCGYMETWDGYRQNGGNESGFMDPFESPHEDALRWVKAANVRAAEIHGESVIRVPGVTEGGQ